MAARTRQNPVVPNEGDPDNPTPVDSYVLYGESSITPAVVVDSSLIGVDEIPALPVDEDGLTPPRFPTSVKATIVVEEVLNPNGLPTTLDVVLRCAKPGDGIVSTVIDQVSIKGEGSYDLAGTVTGPFCLTAQVTEGNSTYNLHADAVLA